MPNLYDLFSVVMMYLPFLLVGLTFSASEIGKRVSSAGRGFRRVASHSKPESGHSLVTFVNSFESLTRYVVIDGFFAYCAEELIDGSGEVSIPYTGQTIRFDALGNSHSGLEWLCPTCGSANGCGSHFPPSKGEPKVKNMAKNIAVFDTAAKMIFAISDSGPDGCYQKYWRQSTATLDGRSVRAGQWKHISLASFESFLQAQSGVQEEVIAEKTATAPTGTIDPVASHRAYKAAKKAAKQTKRRDKKVADNATLAEQVLAVFEPVDTTTESELVFAPVDGHDPEFEPETLTAVESEVL